MITNSDDLELVNKMAETIGDLLKNIPKEDQPEGCCLGVAGFDWDVTYLPHQKLWAFRLYAPKFANNGQIVRIVIWHETTQRNIVSLLSSAIVAINSRKWKR